MSILQIMSKKIVRSWDVFDTLISRKCVHHYGIFDLMGATLGAGFTLARVEAEIAARASKQEVTLEDIYDKLQTAYGWSGAERKCALESEIRIEFENVIPITENLSRVRDGDIIISDMYLSHGVIESLLRSAGLKKTVTLFVSNNGKADGSMWKLLRKKFYILKHTGDNSHSDFLRPLRHGIPASITEASAETRWERVLRCNGAPALSAYVREMRLGTFHENESTRTIQKSQIEANFPLLLLSSAALVRWCIEKNITRALMSSRDCILWEPLAKKVASEAGSKLLVEYFLTSRVAALKSSESFLEYASKRIKPDSVVVDLSMTGVSLAGLADRLGISEVRAFAIASHQSISKTLYGEGFHAKAKVSIESLTSEVIEDDLEAINQAVSPSVHDVHESSSGLSVTYASENRSRSVLDAVRIQNAAFIEVLDRVPQSVLAEALTIATSTSLKFLVRECARHSSSFKTVISRARPGAALWNDPNGIKLNLPYTTQPGMRRFAYTIKRLLKPLTPPGSLLRSFAKTLLIVFQAIKRTKK
jgi:predicted HAD superfamily hydrolase